MRKYLLVAVVAVEIYGAARWWRGNRRAGAGFVNLVVDPWLERRGLVAASRGELGLIEHVGRRSGIVRRTPIHPMPFEGGYRIIVPIGDQSEWVQNVLAAGHCRLVLGDSQLELDEPVVETPAEVPGLPHLVRALFGWLGFRYLRLRELSERQVDVVVPPAEAAPVERLRLESVETFARPGDRLRSVTTVPAVASR